MFDMLDRCGGNQGKAAEALGISRRTLLRKLKAYRENESETAVGTLCAEQQRYYRKQTSAPVQLTAWRRINGSQLAEHQPWRRRSFPA